MSVEDLRGTVVVDVGERNDILGLGDVFDISTADDPPTPIPATLTMSLDA